MRFKGKACEIVGEKEVFGQHIAWIRLMEDGSFHEVSYDEVEKPATFGLGTERYHLPVKNSTTQKNQPVKRNWIAENMRFYKTWSITFPGIRRNPQCASFRNNPMGHRGDANF